MDFSPLILHKYIMEILFQIDAPHFCAGAVMSEGKVIKAAPILHYMKGWDTPKVQSYCRKRGWKYWEKVDGGDLMDF